MSGRLTRLAHLKSGASRRLQPQDHGDMDVQASLALLRAICCCTCLWSRLGSPDPHRPSARSQRFPASRSWQPPPRRQDPRDSVKDLHRPVPETRTECAVLPSCCRCVRDGNNEPLCTTSFVKRDSRTTHVLRTSLTLVGLSSSRWR
jgi:hypothetical protein